jgi:hypothetical protein
MMNEQTILILVSTICFVGLFAILSLVVILPMLGIFGGLGFLFKKRFDQAKEMKIQVQDWPRTTGTILKSRVQVSGGDITSVHPHIEYRYLIGAIEYTSTQIRPGDQILSIYGGNEAYDLVDQYPVGAEVDVFYNPEDPSQAVLEK